MRELLSKSMGNIAGVVTIESDLNPVVHHAKKLIKPYLQ